MAFAEMGELDTAWTLFHMLNPINRSRSSKELARYRVEPYVMAADIYGLPPYIGRGGWTWYTGAGGWMYRLALETLLGLERYPDHLRLNPRLPSNGPQQFRIVYRHEGCTYTIHARRAEAGGKPQTVMDDQVQSDGRIPLLADGRDHAVRVTFL